jgi:hypothetical protein
VPVVVSATRSRFGGGDEGQRRTQLRHGLRHALVIDAQKEPVLFQQRVN